MIKLITLLLVVLYTQIEHISTANAPFSKCLVKPTNVKIESLQIENCNSKKRCVLKQGSKAKITIVFVADKDYKDVERVIYGIMNNGTDNAPDAVEVPFGKKKEACQLLTGDFNGGKTCKEGGLQKGNTYTFQDVIEVLPEYPKLSLTARYILREENARGSTTPLDRRQKANWRLHPGSALFCIRVPVVIK